MFYKIRALRNKNGSSSRKMYRLRIKYAKEDSLRFLSHLEMIRALERALRRAKLPLVFSQGFSPHPKMSFGPPLPVGASSQKEYFDIILEKEVVPEGVLESLNRSLPDGLKALEAKYLPLNAPSLTETIDSATYRILVQRKLARSGGLQASRETDLKKLSEYLKSFLAQKQVLVERSVKGKLVSFNLFDRLIRFKIEKLAQNEAILEIACRLKNGGSLRPDEAIEALSRFCGMEMEILKIERI